MLVRYQTEQFLNSTQLSFVHIYSLQSAFTWLFQYSCDTFVIFFSWMQKQAQREKVTQVRQWQIEDLNLWWFVFKSRVSCAAFGLLGAGHGREGFSFHAGGRRVHAAWICLHSSPCRCFQAFSLGSFSVKRSHNAHSQMCLKRCKHLERQASAPSWWLVSTALTANIPTIPPNPLLSFSFFYC